MPFQLTSDNEAYNTETNKIHGSFNSQVSLIVMIVNVLYISYGMNVRLSPDFSANIIVLQIWTIC